MNIIQQNYKWNGSLQERSETAFIVLHHRAGDGDAESIHKTHIGNGFVGIGYHFYVRKNGQIYKGRPIGTVGAHATGVNGKSIGVCFEGNYENLREMPYLQMRGGKELISYLKGLYPKAQIVRHCDLQKTACPGRNFPFGIIKEGVKDMTVEEAVEIIQAKIGLEDETVEFMLCYKYGEELILKIAGALV